MDSEISLDTQAVLLLRGKFDSRERELTAGQYRVFAAALNTLGKRPADLLGDDASVAELVHQACLVPNENKHIRPATEEEILGLLHRGIALAMARGKWDACGIHVVSRADEIYPKRMRTYLKGQAPDLIYYVGNPELFAGGGMAFVGARDLDDVAGEAIRKVARECVDLRMPIVSGGARGADQVSMREAFDCGGQVIGALPCDLMKRCLESETREALASGNTLLFSAFDPEAKPFKYSIVAMERNKYIYAMADGCFVAQSGVGPKSGTWSGAHEDLKREGHHPVFVFLGNLPSLGDKPSDGCLKLQEEGAIAWDIEKSVSENLDAVVQAASCVCQPDSTSCVCQPDFFTGESEPVRRIKKRTRKRAK